ncbi:MAG: hypothetical protein EAZ30_15565 [Betaproteobacteria bacterium]|nr:MAG: hypothetical protein EAZ30_15565 [Betaproteobacteria bacterium]
MVQSVCPPAPGYRFEVLTQETVPALISALGAWQPNWRVGAASVFLREDYYRSHVYLEGGPQRDVFVVLFRHGDELAGMSSVQRDADALALFASLTVTAPAHRGGLAMGAKGDYLEEVAKLMGLQYVYCLATLKHRGAQRYMESLGYKVMGFAYGYDHEEISPGIIKRVVEVGYAKCLVDRDAMLTPDVANMTPEVRRLYEFIFAAPAVPSAA